MILPLKMMGFVWQVAAVLPSHVGAQAFLGRWSLLDGWRWVSRVWDVGDTPRNRFVFKLMDFVLKRWFCLFKLHSKWWIEYKRPGINEAPADVQRLVKEVVRHRRRFEQVRAADPLHNELSTFWLRKTRKCVLVSMLICIYMPSIVIDLSRTMIAGACSRCSWWNVTARR